MNRLPQFPKHTITTMFLCLLAFCTTGCVRSLNPFATPAMVVNSEYYTETDQLPDELKRYLPYAVDYYTPDNDLNKYHAPKISATWCLTPFRSIFCGLAPDMNSR